MKEKRVGSRGNRQKKAFFFFFFLKGRGRGKVTLVKYLVFDNILRSHFFFAFWLKKCFDGTSRFYFYFYYFYN
jgi:hypothetical protein